MKKIILILSGVLLFALSNKDIRKIYYESYNYEKMGDYKDAIKVLIPLYKEYSNAYTLNLRLGWLFYLNKNYENAIKHYNLASKIYSYSLEPKLGLMRVFNIMGKYNNTIKIGNIILRNDYYNYYGNYYYGNALLGIKNCKNAILLANKMLTLYPTSVLFLNLLGKSYFYNKEFKKAKDIFENVLILDPNNVVAKEFLKRIKGENR